MEDLGPESKIKFENKELNNEVLLKDITVERSPTFRLEADPIIIDAVCMQNDPYGRYGYCLNAKVTKTTTTKDLMKQVSEQCGIDVKYQAIFIEDTTNERQNEYERIWDPELLLYPIAVNYNSTFYVVIVEDPDQLRMDLNSFVQYEMLRFVRWKQSQHNCGPKTSEQNDKEKDSINNAKFPILLYDLYSQTIKSEFVDFSATSQQSLSAIDSNTNNHHHIMKTSGTVLKGDNFIYTFKLSVPVGTSSILNYLLKEKIFKRHKKRSVKLQLRLKQKQQKLERLRRSKQQKIDETSDNGDDDITLCAAGASHVATNDHVISDTKAKYFNLATITTTTKIRTSPSISDRNNAKSTSNTNTSLRRIQRIKHKIETQENKDEESDDIDLAHDLNSKLSVSGLTGNKRKRSKMNEHNDASHVDTNDNAKKTIEEQASHESEDDIDEAQSVEFQLELAQKAEVIKAQQQERQRLKSKQSNMDKSISTDGDEAANDEKSSIFGGPVIIDNASTLSIKDLNDFLKSVVDESEQCKMNEMIDRPNEQASNIDNHETLMEIEATESQLIPASTNDQIEDQRNLKPNPSDPIDENIDVDLYYDEQKMIDIPHTSRKKLITFECCTDDTYDAGNATSVDPIRKLAVNLEELRIQNCACHCTIDASYVDVNDNGQETIEKTNHKSKNNIDEAQSVEVQLRLDQKDEVTKVQQQAIERLESEQLNLEEPMNTDDDEAANIVDHVHANDQNQQLDEKFSICGETVIIDNASTSSIEILNDSVKYVNDVSGQCNMNKMMDRSNEQAPDTDNVMLDENGQTMFDDPLPDITEIFKQMVISRKFIPNSMVLEIGLEYKNILWHILQSKDEPAKHLNQWKRYYMFWKIMLVYMKEEHKKAMAIFDDLKAVLNKDHHGKHLFSEIALQLRCLGGEDDASPEIDRLRSHGGKIIRDL